MTAVWCLLAAVCVAGAVLVTPRLRAWNRRKAAEHEAWLNDIQAGDREVSLMEEIHRRRSPQHERRE
ncbi:hypothetical protein [Streptacidiphilus jiangxiensis]|uniref:hypothetical protein n=1 Tax=Streptacidiphilus jiangxiensis TaxID=235985 RepID=UPI0005A6B600|nr:hypothetical protein [Streptacidiphilus jiangxiensis]